MGEQEFNNLFARNLTYFMNLNHKTQSDLSKDLQLSKATVSSWCNATRVPRMDKVDMLCDYFNIRRSDLMDEKENGEKYYLNQEVQELAQEMMEKPNLHMLCDASRDLSPEDMQIVIDMVNRMNK